MGNKESVIIIGFTNGKEVSHHGEIADELHDCFAYTDSNSVFWRKGSNSIYYPRNHIISVAYEERR